MHVAEWTDIAERPVPYTELSWTTHEDAERENPKTDGSLLLRSPAAQHRYGPLPRSWYDILREHSSSAKFRHLLTAATVTAKTVETDVQDIFPHMKIEPATAVTANRYARTFRLLQSYDTDVSDTGVAAGAVYIAREQHGVDGALRSVADNARPELTEERVQSTSAVIQRSLSSDIIDIVGRADRDGVVEELSVRRH